MSKTFHVDVSMSMKLVLPQETVDLLNHPDFMRGAVHPALYRLLQTLPEDQRFEKYIQAQYRQAFKYILESEVNLDEARITFAPPKVMVKGAVK